MKRYAVYRILYGEDFIQESIQSISDYVDKIFIFWTNKALGGYTDVIYKNELVHFPKRFDSVIEKIRHTYNPKITLIEDYVENNINQFTHLVNDFVLTDFERPDEILFMEPDHVWRTDQLELAIKTFAESGLMTSTVNQIELWKEPRYRIPRRLRTSSVFWNMHKIGNKIPPTKRQADITGVPYINAEVHNLGFCVSPRSMLWKHLTAIAFSAKIGDTPPREDWYDKTWMAWDFNKNNSNLEIAKGYEHLIPRAIPYDTDKLPELIKLKYEL